MEDIKDKSLRLALEGSGCTELPKSRNNDDDGFWIKAIVLVRKSNFTTSYAMAERRGDGCINYTRDFGDMSPIMGLISVHPYLYLDERLIPSSESSNYHSIISRELGINNVDEVRGYSSSRLVSCAREVAIKRQREKIAADAYADEISRIMDEDSRNNSDEPYNEDDIDEVKEEEVPKVTVPKKRGRKKL